MKYEEGHKIASEIYQLLAPHSEIIHVAGSIRRKMQEVHDIEILAYPKRAITSVDLFGKYEQTACSEFFEALYTKVAVIVKGKPDGRYMQMILKNRKTLDLFLPDRSDYYRQLAIRTGSSAYSTNVIAAAWVRKGWVGAGEHGLRRKEDCQTYQSGDKTKWKCINLNGELPPEWESEEDFFKWLEVRYESPINRNITSSIYR